MAGFESGDNLSDHEYVNVILRWELFKACARLRDLIIRRGVPSYWSRRPLSIMIQGPCT